MSAPKFTPGPLTVGQRSATTYTVRAKTSTGRDVTIAACYGWPGIVAGETIAGAGIDAEANARLYAAAPRLYALLERAHGMIDPEMGALYDDMREDIAEALADARGDAPAPSILDRIREPRS